jgi:prepilin-type N-terminal cleavage/methylation domain-containing protein
MKALCRRGRSEAGYTLLEMMVVMMVMSLVTAIFVTILASVQGSIGRVSARSDSNDQARLAVEELDREIRSGNVLYDPNLTGSAHPWSDDSAHGIYPGMSLLIYTQTNASTRSPGNQCVQWRITNEQLQRRAWSVNWQTDGIVSGWRIVAERILNRSPASDQTKWVRAFTLDPAAIYGNRIVNITILANGSLNAGQTVRIKESITGRNTEYGYPNNICTAIPQY